MLIRDAEMPDALAIARVQVESWRTTYRGIVSDAHIDALSYESREPRWREFLAENKEQFALVAETEEKRVVGFISGGKSRELKEQFDGELYAIYLLKEFQQRGIGRRLVKIFVDRLLRQNISSMFVWVLAENPSREFYEKLGGKFVTDKEIIMNGQTLTEIAYGWTDLQALLESLNHG